MFRPRVIPVLLLKNQGLVKSIKFKNHRYIGDPINAVKLFNDLKADELVFLDINASKNNSLISLDFIKKVGDEANMPFAVGGGIQNTSQIKQILNAGAEKVVINTQAAINPDFIKHAAQEFGSSTIVVAIDVKRDFWKKERTCIFSGTKYTKYEVVDFAQMMEKLGAGEIIINSIDHDGMMLGYNLGLIKKVAESVTIPIVAMGGAGKIDDLKLAVDQGLSSAVGAGSLFVYYGPRRAVLINYPTREELKTLFK